MSVIVGNSQFVTANSDIFTWTLTLTNNGTSSSTGTIVTMSEPSGTNITSGVPTFGTYNTGTNVWTIGNFAPGQTATIVLTLTVTDIGEAPFVFGAVASANESEDVILNNTVEGTVYQLCNAFSSCFVNSSMLPVTLPMGEADAESVYLTIIDQVEGPSCGDIVIVGGGCSETWISMYSCVGSDWSVPIKISTPLIFANSIFVDPLGNDSTAVKGSMTCKFRTIQAAVDAADGGDTIVILPGYYVIDEPININGHNNLIFDIKVGAYVVSDTYTLWDDGTYSGPLTIGGGGTIQANYEAGTIILSNTDITTKVYISDIEIINYGGILIKSENPLFLKNVGLYDISGTMNCIDSNSSITAQCRNVVSNIVESANVTVSISPITVDTGFSLNYI